MPENTVYVGRGSKWGNPYQGDGPLTARMVVQGYRLAIRAGYDNVPGSDEIGAELRGKDLACWCPLSEPCHADVLLELANPEEVAPHVLVQG